MSKFEKLLFCGKCPFLKTITAQADLKRKDMSQKNTCLNAVTWHVLEDGENPRRKETCLMLAKHIHSQIEELQPTELTIKKGKFYWIVPTFDPNTGKSWEKEIQPARYAGNGSWNCLNINTRNDWSMMFTGNAIKRPGEKT